MTYSINDKKIESNRYDKRAEKLLSMQVGLPLSNDILNRFSSTPFDLKPSGKYQEYVRKFAKKKSIVLELGSGTGRFTKALLDSGAKVVATDISHKSLEVIRRRYTKYYNNLVTQVADIEKLPFDNNSFDIVSSSAVLSYGGNIIVMKEILRVLKPGGFFICIDSLNENPIYKLNRWFNYKKGNRSLSTLTNMPTIKLIEEYKVHFDIVVVKFYGSIIWIYPILKFLIGKTNTVLLINRFDALIKTYKSGFKFVAVFRKN